jgi:hypothetical protein
MHGNTHTMQAARGDPNHGHAVQHDSNTSLRYCAWSTSQTNSSKSLRRPHLSAPASVMMLAVNLAAMDSRPSTFRSARAYPAHSTQVAVESLQCTHKWARATQKYSVQPSVIACELHPADGEPAQGSHAAQEVQLTVIGDDGCDGPSAGPLARVNHDKQLHQVVVDGWAGGLNQEHVTTTDGFPHLCSHEPMNGKHAALS